MRSFNSYRWDRAEAGETFQLPWPALTQVAELRKKQMLVVAGEPGGGKTTLASNLVAHMKQPTLYFAQDDPDQPAHYVTSMLLNEDTKDIHNNLDQQQRLLEIPESEKMIIKTGSVALRDMSDRMEAYYEWAGMYPSVVVLDNLINTRVASRSGEQFNYHSAGFYAELLPRLKDFSIDYGLLMVVLHHIRRDTASAPPGTKPDRPPRLHDLMYGGEREADHVWYAQLGEDISPRSFKLYILKQRTGKADRWGGLFVDLDWVPPYGKLIDMTVEFHKQFSKDYYSEPELEL